VHLDGHLLFSGDSLAWDPTRERLTAFRRACWYPWDAQTESLDRFARSELRFDRLLCGHGSSHDAPEDVFHDRRVGLVARMPARR
jgi:glyoxylase-like metal-dependent hydrolase (beta-lactamase superfamily II)